MDEITARELLLCLPKTSRKTILVLVENAEDSLAADSPSFEIQSQYKAIKDLIKSVIE